MAPSRQLTEQQRLAVETRGVSVVLSSGAGCGKTTVLTQRYLSHLEEGAEVGQVVAITFTDRAARQMRDRIRREVTERLKDPTTDADTWARHLRNLETAPISTIHAFCGALLRQYSLEAGLDPRFEVLEEVLSVNLEAEALNSGLQRLLTAQTAAGEDLRQLILLYGWRAVVEAVRELLTAWDDKPWRDWLDVPPDAIARRWQEYGRDELLPRYLVFLLTSKPRVAHCLGLLRQFPPLPGEMASRVAFILDKTPRLSQAADLPAAIEELTKTAQVGKIGAKAWPDTVIYEQIKTAFTQFREELRKWDLQELTDPGDNLDTAALTTQRVVRVVGDVVQTYRERKRQHGVVDFQDLLLQARDLLRDHAEVTSQLRERYRHLLIDELQDTDPVQIELVESLCGDKLKTGKLFAVGDHNQSIYRFRGADVHLFQALREQMPADGRQHLTLNYRSQPAILDFVNTLFQTALTDYEPLHAHGTQVSRDACVEFLWSPREEKANVAEARQTEANWIAARIAAMIGREAIVRVEGEAEKLRPVKAGDVVLLFRAMSNVHLYEAALRQHGLNYYLVGGRAFFAQQEIYDLLNLLRALENPQDSVSLVGTLRSPFCCVSDEALFILGRDRRGVWVNLHDETLESQLPDDQRQPVARARRNLARWRQSKDRLPIARLLGTVFAESGYDAATQFEHLGDRKLANLWKLLDLARTFDRSGLFGLAEFIDRLGDLVKNQPREEQAATQPENADVVRLMTIHQAKGLEFPVVIVPDVVATGGGSATPIARWDTQLGCVVKQPPDEEPVPFPKFPWRLSEVRNQLEDWHEALRTLYVACTRAEDYLILSGAMKPGYQADNAWMTTLAALFDLTTGACQDSTVAPERRPRVRICGAGDFVPAVVKALDRTDPSPGLPLPPTPIPARAIGGRCLTIAEPSPLVLALRTVLESWDFSDLQRLQELVRRHGAGHETLFQRFGHSATCRELAAATSRQWGTEFALNLGPDLPVVQGTIDCVWQDADGYWHLLYFTTEPATKAERERLWKQREREIVLAAIALQRQNGSWPKTVQLFLLAEGETIRRVGNRLPTKRILANG